MTDRPHSLDPAEGGSDPGDRGWGSPVPAEYGSLRAVRPPQPTGDGADPTGVPGRGRQVSTSSRWQRLHQPSKPTLSDRLRNRGGSEGPHPISELKAESAPSEPWSRDPGLDNGAVDGHAGPTALASPAGLATAAVVETDDRQPALQPGAGSADLRSTTSLTGEQVGAAAALVAVENRSRRRRSRKALRVRSRVTIRHIDVLTVARVSVIFYLLVGMAVVVASVLLYYAANAYGSLDSIEKSVRTLFDLKTFTLHVGKVAEYTAAGGVALALVGTVFNVLAALTYNLICDIVGGFRIEVESTTTAPSESQG